MPMPQRLRAFAFALLPWGGYLAALWAAPEMGPLRLTHYLGWALLLVYQTIKLGVVLAEPTGEGGGPGWRALLASLLPAALIALAQARSGGGLLHFLLEQFAMEVGVMLLAIMVVLAMEKNQAGRRSWQDLGGMPLLFMALIAAGGSGILHTWWVHNEIRSADAVSLTLLASAMASELRQQLGLMGRVLRRELRIADVMSGPQATPLILGQLVGWLAAPALRLLQDR